MRDLIQQTLEALWRRRDDADPPDNLARVIALAKHVLRGKLNDFFRNVSYERRHRGDLPRPPRDDGDDDTATRAKDAPDPVDEGWRRRSSSP